MFPDIKCDIKGYSNNNYLYNLTLVTKYKVLSKQEKGHFNLGPKSVVKNTQIVSGSSKEPMKKITPKFLSDNPFFEHYSFGGQFVT